MHNPTTTPRPTPVPVDDAADQRRQRRAMIGGLGTLAAVIIGTAATAGAARQPTLVGCKTYEVRAGDTLSGIAAKHGRKLDDLKATNGHLEAPTWNLLYVGDVVNIDCPPAPVETPAVVDEREDGSDRLTMRSLVSYLYAAGFRGDALVTMAAVCTGESGRDPDILGDTTITTAKWSASVGACQVRALHELKGTGATRDEDALVDPMHNAQASFEISGGGANFKPWTVYLNGSYKRFTGEARSAARDLGLVK